MKIEASKRLIADLAEDYGNESKQLTKEKKDASPDRKEAITQRQEKLKTFKEEHQDKDKQDHTGMDTDVAKPFKPPTTGPTNPAKVNPTNPAKTAGLLASLKTLATENPKVAKQYKALIKSLSDEMKEASPRQKKDLEGYIKRIERELNDVISK